MRTWWLQTNSFVQLAKHSLFRRFAPVYASLWKLPAMRTDTLAPEDLILTVEQNDADVSESPLGPA